MDIPGLSIVIPHYGDPVPTRDLISRLRAQQTKRELQIIISDDASLPAFEAGRGYDVVHSHVNTGFGAAVNRGAALARHPMLMILNSDVDPEVDFIESFTAAAEPLMPAVVSPAVREPWGMRCVERTWPTVRSVALEHLTLLARFHGQDWMTRAIGHDTAGWRRGDTHRADWAMGVCLLLPTSEFVAVGGFDERFFMYCEETDLQRRLTDERGVKTVVVGEAVLDHVGGGSSASHLRAGWLMDSRMKYHEKWGGASRLYVSLAAVFAANAVWGAARYAAGRSVAPLATWRRDMGKLTEAWHRRR